MPTRKQALVNGEIYHVFNKSVDGISLFKEKQEFLRAMTALWFYRSEDLLMSLSRYFRLAEDPKIRASILIDKKVKKVSVLSYCLMNNHFHLLVRQESEEGIFKICGRLSE